MQRCEETPDEEAIFLLSLLVYRAKKHLLFQLKNRLGNLVRLNFVHNAIQDLKQ